MISKPKLYVEIEPCIIESINGNTLIAIPIKRSNNKSNRQKTVVSHDGNFSDFKLGQQVICITYYYEHVYPWTYTEDIGVIDKNTYNTAMRDSQKLPKGWECFPTFANSVEYGTIAEINKEDMYYISDETGKLKAINITDVDTYIADDDIGSGIEFKVKPGCRIAVADYLYVNPYRQKIKATAIYTEKNYKEEVEKYLEDNQKTTRLI